jgi:hypothetical protein
MEHFWPLPSKLQQKIQSVIVNKNTTAVDIEWQKKLLGNFLFENHRRKSTSLLHFHHNPFECTMSNRRKTIGSEANPAHQTFDTFRILQGLPFSVGVPNAFTSAWTWVSML